jgi:hypothetical protein
MRVTRFKAALPLVAIVLLAASVPAAAQSFSQGFDDITTLVPAGWVMTNHSNPVGTTTWFQGNATIFPAQTGATNSYIGANYNSTGSVGTINTWLLTPPVTFVNGDTLTFYSRIPTVTASEYPDRLEVRLSTNGVSSNVGTTETEVGDFTTVLLSINPTLVTGVYPQVWTQFTATVTGVPAATQGRLAFRYFVTNGGTNGANSNYFGIDTLVFTTTTPVSLMKFEVD